MSTILEVLFDLTNRWLRPRGPLGVLVGLLLIVYVEIPVITVAARDEIQSVMRGVTRDLEAHERRAPHGRGQLGHVHHRSNDRPTK